MAQDRSQDPNEGAGFFILRLVPPDFEVPETADAPTFSLHPLCLRDADEDYAAIMADYADHARHSLPEPDLSIGETYDRYTNSWQLGWHECEFNNRSSFAWVIRGKDPALPSYRGCLYFFPSPKRDHDVAVYLWVTTVPDPDDDLEREVIEWTQAWLKEHWPFSSPVWPGRLTSWEVYAGLPGGRTYGSQ